MVWFILSFVCLPIALAWFPAEYPAYCNKNTTYRKIPPLTGAQIPLVDSLQQVQVIIRHGARTPYTNYQCWKDYDISWNDCNVTELMLASPSYTSPDRPAPWLFRKLYDASPNYLGGNCYTGQLISEGYTQEEANGQYLYDAYLNSQFKLFDTNSWTSIDTDSLIYLRSDDAQRTLMSGQILLHSMFNITQEVIVPWHTGDYGLDEIYPNEDVCPRLSTLETSIYNTPDTIARGKSTVSLLASKSTSFKAKFSVQEMVEVNYKSKGKWYPAKIWKIHTLPSGQFAYDVDFNSGNREFKVPQDRLRKPLAGAAVANSPMLTKSSSLISMKTPQTPKTGPGSHQNTPSSLTKTASVKKISRQGSGDSGDSKILTKYSTASSRMKMRSPSITGLSDNGMPQPNTTTQTLERRKSTASISSKDSRERTKPLKKTMTLPVNGTHSANGSVSGHSGTSGSGTGGLMNNLHVQHLLAGSASNLLYPLQELHTSTFDTLDATSVLTDNEVDDLDFIDNTTHATTQNNTPNGKHHVVTGLGGFTTPPADALSTAADDLNNNDQSLTTTSGKYGFVLGDRVEVNFRMIGKWYPGYIKRCRGNGIYDIDYDDGSVETRVDGQFIRFMESELQRESKYRPGDYVEANTGGFGYWHPAMIIKVRSQGKYDIQYDNGDQEYLVTERLLRLQRMDSIIPKIRPFFSMGERVFIKTRSSTLDAGIRQYREMQKQANLDLFGVFKIMKRIEEEEGYVNLLKKKTRSTFTALLIFKEDVRSLSGKKAFFDDVTAGSNEMKLKLQLEQYEQVMTQMEVTLYQCEEEVMKQKQELRKALAEIASIQRKSGQFRSITVASRSGVEEEEFHILTVAQENCKEEIKALERTRGQAIEVIDALSTARQRAHEKLKAVIAAIKAAKAMVEHVLNQDLEELTLSHVMEIISPTPSSGNLASTSGTVGGTGNRVKRTGSTEVDYGRIYGSGNNTRDANDEVDIGYDNVYGQSFDTYSSKGGDTVVDVYMPTYDDRYYTGLGGLLLGEKKLPSESQIMFEESMGSPKDVKRRRRSSQDQQEQFVIIHSEKCAAPDRRMKLTKHYYLNVSAGVNSAGSKQLVYNVTPDGNRSFTISLVTNNSNIATSGITTAVTINSNTAATTTNADNSSGPLSIQTNIELTVPPPPTVMVAATMTKEDQRIVDKKKAAEEKKARASIAQAAYFKYAATLAQDREQCEVIQKEIDQFIVENELRYILDNKFGITYEASKARIQPMVAIAQQCDQARITTEETAFKYQAEALKCYEQALNARRLDLQPAATPAPPTTTSANEGLVYLPPAEIMQLWDATKAAYVLEWSQWEEARVMIEEEKAAYKNVIIAMNRSYRDLNQLTKIRNDVTIYLTMRQEYFEKRLLIAQKKLLFESKVQRFEKMKELITNESHVHELVIKAMIPAVNETPSDNNNNANTNNNTGTNQSRPSIGGRGGGIPGSRNSSFTFSPFAYDDGSRGNSRRNSTASPTTQNPPSHGIASSPAASHPYRHQPSSNRPPLPLYPHSRTTSVQFN